MALITILKKNGDSLIAKIDSVDLEKVQNVGTWFAEWHRDFNNYLVQNISLTKVNKKSKPLKQSLQTVVMDITATTPVKHINGDPLDNRKCNLEVFRRTDLNEIEEIDEDTIAIILRDKYGNVNSKALISIEDLNNVITDEYIWVNYKVNGDTCVIANTPNGRIHLDRILMNPGENKTIHHINLNPLDNRRHNLELTDI
ncbi:hypothetical protein H7E67_08500 [Clostridium gasigenes]|uniref:HNH endonuclease n=1 Tax=Clostridium gasigenes TaxID=94869 RepID=A0A7X0SD37_9CLOT|nr:hypothetical protein [Clostridium gasigenes]MBB6623466.1 hypothetical protein [Clostridium gasigenes]MBB6715339.1 hypothetical protein [Clostridium gasigenes]MBU3089641.1 hypothetical protein [Clostridium gasigenes]MBU3104758.1 hypothetical protein [Clostridium gasigenes]MBU3108548.1 hypothetical protein [Clostridium gasigenes]